MPLSLYDNVMNFCFCDLPAKTLRRLFYSLVARMLCVEVNKIDEFILVHVSLLSPLKNKKLMNQYDQYC